MSGLLVLRNRTNESCQLRRAEELAMELREVR